MRKLSDNESELKKKVIYQLNIFRKTFALTLFKHLGNDSQVFQKLHFCLYLDQKGH